MNGSEFSYGNCATGINVKDNRETWSDSAIALIDANYLVSTVSDMVSIPSPSGNERKLSESLAAKLAEAGLEAMYQPIDSQRGNAIGWMSGAGDGPNLLLYAPIDTHIAGNPSEDCPWAGPSLRKDMLPQPLLEDGFVIGLCAENPKGYAACLLAAVNAVKKAGVPLTGDVLVGFGAGGMPTNRGKASSLLSANIGHGVGCQYLLEQGIRPDFAVLAKPGWAVSWEEVGLCWFRIRLRGRLGYTGQRHSLAHKNPILDAAKVIEGLERWFPEYTVSHTSGLVAPQGSIGAIEGGWTHKPTFIPAACDVYVDLRLSPRATPAQIQRELRAALERICADEAIDFDCRMVLSISSHSTCPDNWIITSSIRAWEAVSGVPHKPRLNTSGSTDANILRAAGIPVARLGMPPQPISAPFHGEFSMGVVEVAGMVKLTKCLIRVIVDTCTRSRDEVGVVQ